MVLKYIAVSVPYISQAPRGMFLFALKRLKVLVEVVHCVYIYMIIYVHNIMYKHAHSVWVVCMYMSKCVCVWETLNQRVKAGGPWTHRWHGPTKTHLCRRENVPAKLSSSEMARWPSQKPPMPTCHAMT